MNAAWRHAVERKRDRGTFGWGRFFAVLLVFGGFAGCRATNPGEAYWPTAPEHVLPSGDDTYLGYDLDRDGRLDYMQRLHDGYKDRLYFPVAPKGALREAVARPAADLKTKPLLLLLLDGVSYERITTLWEQGHFRLFRRPARVVSTFPSLTDVAYDVFFRTGPTPGYEAGYFDRANNCLTDGIKVYLHGDDERWVNLTDYRMSTLRDAFMYLSPKSTFQTELQIARKRLDECFARGRRSVVLYTISTDGLGHMLPVAELEKYLIELDGWLERIVYDYRGGLEIAVMADHGNTTTPPKRFFIQEPLEAEGLHVQNQLRQTGDVAVPLFGLLDVARVHTYDDATRDRVIEILKKRPEVELLIWREGQEACVEAKGVRARVSRREAADGPRYKYEPQTGDPLGYQDIVTALQTAGLLDADGFAASSAWLNVSQDHAYPAAPPRLWDGMYVLSDEHPDVAVCLGDGWFVGSGFLAGFVTMKGTHGGLHRRCSDTFVMSTGFEILSPLQLTDVYDILVRQFAWQPRARGE